MSPTGARRPEAPRRVQDIDRPRWKPTERATLLFIIVDGRILLIEKKTGLGAGKVNGPGGRIKPGEPEREAAIREVEEELAVTPTGVARCGELSFQFVDGYSLHGVVFTATGYRGTPTETREAAPLWCPASEVPFDRMWADDRLWFPLMLSGRSFAGRFIFDGDLMLDAVVREVRAATPRVQGL